MNAPADLDALRNYLATRDAACPSCGYNLRGLSVQVCPECNQEIELRVALSEPKLGLFLFGIIGWSLGAGFSSLLGLFFLVRLIQRSWSIGPTDQLLFQIIVVGVVVQGGAVIALAANQRRVRRWSLRVRVTVALLGYIVSLANLLMFALLEP